MISWFRSIARRIHPRHHVKLHPRASKVDESEVDVRQVYSPRSTTRSRTAYDRERFDVSTELSNAINLHAELTVAANARLLRSTKVSQHQIERVLALLQSTRQLLIGTTLPSSPVLDLALNLEQRLREQILQNSGDSCESLDDTELATLILVLERYIGQKVLREVSVTPDGNTFASSFSGTLSR